MYRVHLDGMHMYRIKFIVFAGVYICMYKYVYIVNNCRKYYNFLFFLLDFCLHKENSEELLIWLY